MLGILASCFSFSQLAMYRVRNVSVSEPLKNETIQFIKESIMEKCGTYEQPHVFVVFGASVGDSYSFSSFIQF